MKGVNMTILDCSFTGNQANSGGGPDAVGGALDDGPGDDTVTISDSLFISNSATGSSVGAGVVAGAVANGQGSGPESNMTISNCQFLSNSAIGSGRGRAPWGCRGQLFRP